MKVARLFVAALAAAVLGAGAPITGAAGQAPTADARVWENYDFIPGAKVIFYTDFSEDRVSNFARGLKYRTGPIEIVERGGVKMLRSTGQSEFLIPVGKKLPDRFTLEIDAIAPRGSCACYDVIAFEGGPELDRGDTSAEMATIGHHDHQQRIQQQERGRRDSRGRAGAA